MKEYKIIRQPTNLLKNTDTEFTNELNQLARDGWRVVTAVTDHATMGLKVILERTKNR